MENTKKPIYKEWWFIALAAFFAIGIIATIFEPESWKEERLAKQEATEQTRANKENAKEDQTVVKEVEKTDPQAEAVANAEEHPAKPGKKLFGSEFKGMKYYFKGELEKTEKVEGLSGNMEEALLVKNEEGFILVIFPNSPIDVKPGDVVEVWGPLSGDGYSSSDLGVDNVVGVTGAINATTINVNGEI